MCRKWPKTQSKYKSLLKLLFWWPSARSSNRALSTPDGFLRLNHCSCSPSCPSPHSNIGSIPFPRSRWVLPGWTRSRSWMTCSAAMDDCRWPQMMHYRVIGVLIHLEIQCILWRVAPRASSEAGIRRQLSSSMHNFNFAIWSDICSDCTVCGRRSSGCCNCSTPSPLLFAPCFACSGYSCS